MWALKPETIGKNSVFWNMMSSGLNSVVSMLLLWVVTRIVGVNDAGIFALAFSTSQMMLTIGNYGMRNYQATDIENKYSLAEYLGSRIVTSTVMILIVIAFVYLEGYYWEKLLVTVLLCVLKVTDAFDDVYGGHYQRIGRLDIAGKIMSIRIITYIIGFCIILITTHNLIASCVVAIVLSIAVLSILVFSTRKVILLQMPNFGKHSIMGLLKECFPLCISAFLLIYLGNAPKYAIDAYMSSEAQAYYTYLFMPCFVINLFVGFALQPLLVKLSHTWIHKEYRVFLKLCGLIFASALIISAVIVVAGRALGCPILSIVFGVDLVAYKDVLTILLIGGGFFSFAVIAQIILTVMRRQFSLLIGFGITSVFEFFIAGPLVKSQGLKGAGFAYTVTAGLLFISLIIMILIFYCKREK